jgi:branched-chain amino acid transport system permease protein/urea transport system permease protein
MDPLLVTQLLNIAYEVTTLAVVVLGLAIVFGLLGVLNLAHGEFVMIGAYCAYFAQTQGWPYLAAIPVTLVVCGALGWAVERALIRPLYQRPFDTLLATWGLSLLLREIVEAIYGKGYKSLVVPVQGMVEIGGADYPSYRVLLIVLSVALVGGLVLWYLRSPTGTRIKAMVGNPDLARAVGIRVERLARNAFIAGTCLGGLGGVMLAPLAPVQPFMGLDYILKAFFVLVVGGLGSLMGLVTGSVIIGGVESVVSAVADRTYGYFSVLVLAILFLWLRPRGIFSRA